MSSRTNKYALIAGLAGFLTVFASPSRSQAGPIVAAGFDLLTTVDGTTFDPDGPGPMVPIPFMGVPLGSFNFGGSIGIKPTGATDTIVQRKAPATTPASTIPIELVALQLQSVNPIAGHSLFITLQSVRGGPASTGQMTINFVPSDTFTSFFDIFFDVRQDSLTGPIVQSGTDHIVTLGSVPWSETPPPGTLVIHGVNDDFF